MLFLLGSNDEDGENFHNNNTHHKLLENGLSNKKVDESKFRNRAILAQVLDYFYYNVWNKAILKASQHFILNYSN